jgi:hypothetical protein
MLQEQVLGLFDQPDRFEEVSLAVFRFQVRHCLPYKWFVEALRINPVDVQRFDQIPYIPIELFKTQVVSVYTDPKAMPNILAFSSSGTTGQTTSTHWVSGLDWYRTVAVKIWERHHGPLSEWTILALLPGYLERSGSSLVTMLELFMQSGLGPESGFYLRRDHELKAAMERAEVAVAKNGTKLLLWGVTHALVSWAQQSGQRPLSNLYHILETGGMKGHGREMIREELHNLLINQLGVPSIMGEYGMTELLSQAYSDQDGIYSPGATMRVSIRDDRDPLTWLSFGQRGLISVADLANIESCAFVATQDVGVLSANGATFEVLGRSDHSDVRGCNLLV